MPAQRSNKQAINDASPNNNNGQLGSTPQTDADDPAWVTVGVRGNMNCDGMLDGRYVQPFVLALLDPVAYAAAYPNCEAGLADMDCSGMVDLTDIQPVVDALLGG